MNNETALLSSVHRRGVTVLLRDGREIDVLVPGRLQRDWKPATGDSVVVAMEPDGRWMLTGVEPRRNSLERSSGDNAAQVIAANIDIALIFASLKNPLLRRGFIDRCMAAAEWHSIRVCVAVNKIDLAEDSDLPLLETLERDCARAGASFARVSCLTGEGTDALRSLLEGRTVVLAGPSGAGKTTLAGLLGRRDDLRIGEVSMKTGKGRHTTVGARIVPLGSGTMLIDTPGLRIFPIDQIPPARLHECFREFAALIDECRFRDCLHSSEPDCAVRNAVERGDVSRERYSSYLELLGELSGG